MLQVLFSLLIVSVIGAALTYLYQNAFAESLSQIQAGILTRATTTADASRIVISDISSVKQGSLFMILAAGALMTIAFGYVVTRIALNPTRNALSAQKQFIGNIAHELRTPLSTIKMNTEILLLDDDIPKDLQTSLKSNVEELDRISDIINNLLTLNTIVRPEPIEFKNIDLGAVTSSAVKKLSRLIERKKISISERTSDYRTVWGNATALEQVIANILKNAINYTTMHGHVSITIEPDYQGSIVLTMQDSGVGIERKDLFRIFEPFYRGDVSRTRGTGGSGLGLAIVSELVKLHQGKISIKSAPRRGTTVTVELPRGKDDEPLDENKMDAIAVDFSS